jgi:hypothetical protein
LAAAGFWASLPLKNETPPDIRRKASSGSLEIPNRLIQS